MSSTASRIAALVALAGAAALAAPGCAAMIGVADDKPVAEDLCSCALLEDLSSCVDLVTSRLEGGGEEAEKWLADYEKNCKCEEGGLKTCFEGPLFCNCPTVRADPFKQLCQEHVCQ
ncbi:MAG: hypothetical protein IT372_06235 [Polyangiaceae bacterium]|nr:hypothetical protein [Polyangiaceae bacterium]